jgi:type I restriction enzyme R subunit
LLDLVRDFIVFEDEGGRLIKKMAGYHQFHAVQVAVKETLRAAELRSAPEKMKEELGRYEAGKKPGGKLGDRRIGVVWHTQGSGKSLTMAFYAGRIIREPAMENPTIVVLTDRNDLDDQLFGTFSRCRELLRQPPVQAENRVHLRELLSIAAGGVVFTTIHKFFPEEKGDRHPTLSTRRNIVVIADEAHRSQYDFIDGFARHMRDALPQASFSASRARQLSCRTQTLARFLGTTSAFTTSSVQYATAQPCQFTMRAGLPNLALTRMNALRSIRILRRLQKVRKLSARRN